MNNTTFTSWALRIITTFIIFQIVYFKLSGDPQCIFVFEIMGMEPYGRFITGLIELVIGVFLLVPSTKLWGIIGAFGVASCCMTAHFTTLGIEINNDGGQLFSMTSSIFVCSIILSALHKDEIFLKINSDI